MRIYLSVATIAVAGMLGSQAIVRAQSSFNSGGSSTFGSRTLGGGVTGGTRSLGSSPSALGTGSSGIGFGTSGTTGNVGTLGTSSPLTRQTGTFVGADSAEMRNFVGAAQAGTNAARGQTQIGLGQRGAAGAAGPNRAARAGGGRGTGAGRSTGEIRTSLSVAFDYPKTVPANLGTALASRVAGIEGIHTLSAVKVQIHDGTATLRGLVATDHDRALIEQLARLEVGIWEVNNELVVARQPETPTLSMPGEAPAENPVQPIPEPPALALPPEP